MPAWECLLFQTDRVLRRVEADARLQLELDEAKKGFSATSIVG
jgi:hypothetical protein